LVARNECAGMRRGCLRIGAQGHEQGKQCGEMLQPANFNDSEGLALKKSAVEKSSSVHAHHNISLRSIIESFSAKNSFFAGNIKRRSIP